MFHLLHYTFSVILLYLSLLNASPLFEDYEDHRTAQRFAQFNCYKKRICTPGPPKVCGYDVKTMELAEFEDKCTFYKINCEGGFFKIVDMLACESKKSFSAMQNSSHFQWQHINTDFAKGSTTERTKVWDKVIPGLVQLVLRKLFQ